MYLPSALPVGPKVWPAAARGAFAKLITLLLSIAIWPDVPEYVVLVDVQVNVPLGLSVIVVLPDAAIVTWPDLWLPALPTVVPAPIVVHVKPSVVELYASTWPLVGLSLTFKWII